MAKEYMKKNVDAIVATALLHNVLVKRGIDMQQKINKRFLDVFTTYQEAAHALRTNQAVPHPKESHFEKNSQNQYFEKSIYH